MKVAAFLPAKGTSQRIKSKNLKLLDGKPLFLHTLEKLVGCDFIDEVYLDSETDEILDLAEYLDYHKMKRDPSLANNATDGHALFYNEARQVDADIYIQILGTSPFIKEETIRKGVEILKNDPSFDSVVLVRRDKQYTWGKNGPNYDINHIPNSKDLDDTVIETMGLYIVRKDVVMTSKKRIGYRPFLMDATPLEAIDINYPEDFELAELISMGITAKEYIRFNMLARHLSSCLISDILFDMKVGGVIRGLISNIPDVKVMGRASTLKLRTLVDGEDPNGIYDGLKTYANIRQGQIIIVETECPEYAYFGELNSNLAIRSGAIATIVAGNTRDVSEVTTNNYPVFSTGYSSADVRGRGTVEKHNKPITIQGVDIKPRDILFADVNGIAVIPYEVESEVITRAIKSRLNEESIMTEIISGLDGYNIFLNKGAF